MKSNIALTAEQRKQGDIIISVCYVEIVSSLINLKFKFSVARIIMATTARGVDNDDDDDTDTQIFNFFFVLTR